jgi:hypothetical protein
MMFWDAKRQATCFVWYFLVAFREEGLRSASHITQSRSMDRSFPQAAAAAAAAFATTPRMTPQAKTRRDARTPTHMMPRVNHDDLAADSDDEGRPPAAAADPAAPAPTVDGEGAAEGGRLPLPFIMWRGGDGRLADAVVVVEDGGWGSLPPAIPAPLLLVVVVVDPSAASGILWPVGWVGGCEEETRRANPTFYAPPSGRTPEGPRNLLSLGGWLPAHSAPCFLCGVGSIM